MCQEPTCLYNVHNYNYKTKPGVECGAGSAGGSVVRESRYVGEHLTFSCGRNRIMLEENKLSRALVGKYVWVSLLRRRWRRMFALSSSKLRIGSLRDISGSIFGTIKCAHIP